MTVFDMAGCGMGGEAGTARQARLVLAGSRLDWLDLAGLGRFVMAASVMAGRGKARQARARRGTARSGTTRMGTDRRGSARQVGR